MSFGGRRRRAWLLLLLVLVIVPRAAWPQGPLGPEFRVNTYTTSTQWSPAVTSDSTGNFVVVWTSYFQDGSIGGVFGQRYAASGAPLGAEFRVNTYTTDAQWFPDVASDASGNFVVVWHRLTQFESGIFESAIFGQRYASTGAPLGSEFRVNSYTTAANGSIAYPAVASDPGGNFVVLWTSPNQDVFGRRFANSGAPLGAEFRVNTYTTSGQTTPSAAYDSAGNFVVVWRSYEQDGSSMSVFGQRYDDSGAPLGSEFRVNTSTPFVAQEPRPAVTADAAGNFVVVWHNLTQYESGIFGQRYASAGTPVGPEFRVNTSTTIAHYRPSVVADPSGNFVVVWATYVYGAVSDAIFGQRYDSSGAPLGSEFRVNTSTTSTQNAPAVTTDAAGNFVVVWQSPQDGAGYGIFGQRYRQIVPVELMRFGIE